MHEAYDYFEHDADMGIVGRGERIEEAFEHAAAAAFAMMADPARITPQASVSIEFEEADAELALVTWLNLLLGQARSHGLIFGRFQLRRNGARWSGTAAGEPWREGLERGVEVKGATLTGLAVTQTDGIWEARCVVDV
ncbi:MAG: archease [Burkholderiales bacterium]|nr:archease [Burkholderiales bacterium]